jgi:hypothetical protein
MKTKILEELKFNFILKRLRIKVDIFKVTKTYLTLLVMWG